MCGPLLLQSRLESEDVRESSECCLKETRSASDTAGTNDKAYIKSGLQLSMRGVLSLHSSEQA